MVNKDRKIALKEILNGWWNAGAQSRQAEIDELKAKKEFRDLLQDLAIKNIKDGYEKQISSLAKTITKFDLEIDELQKRVDDALKYVSESPLKDVSRKAALNFLDILKGQNHD